MALDPILFIALALALGFKHSYDADHLVAVSNLLTRSKSLRRTAWMSISWAAGHMITATVVTIILYAFRETLLREFLAHLELAVAVMLVVIGVLGLLVEFDLLHRHFHRHESEEHIHTHFHLSHSNEHRAMFGIGVVHGLASNDELLILFVASLSVTSLAGLLGGVGVFSFGVVLGMILFGIGISYPLSRWGDARVRRVVNVLAAVLSISYAGFLFLGFEGVNLLPV
ncbi:MAG TPA: sulfite exporter TauE/SafE family protein [Thermoplasmata archaeon]|nr:sulfite exporter TauE/SafE family protein [Thermoplasmata archaeon]